MKRYLKYYSALFVITIAITAMSQEKFGNKLIKRGPWKGREVQYVEREINIKIKRNAEIQEVKNTLSDLRLTVVEDVDVIRWMLVETDSGSDIFEIMTALQKNPHIEDVELNGVGRALTEPNDQYFADGHQWSLKNTGQNPPAGTNDADIDAPEAWEITQGSSSIKIAILDSGIPKIDGDLSHPDLDEWSKYQQIVDYINEGGEGIYGKCKDYFGHGTHVTGILGAETNNTIGVAGLANGCTFYIYKVFDENGSVAESDFKNAVIHAVNAGVNIINYSGRIPYPTQLTEDAISYANGNNQYGLSVTVIAAAGNTGGSLLEAPAFYSGSYSNVIAVGWTDHNDVRSTNSNYSSLLNVVAPGGYGLAGQSSWDSDDIYSTTPNYAFTLYNQGRTTQEYGYLAGSSMAAPMVSGIAGLMLSLKSDLTPSQVRDIIQSTADDKGATGFDNYYGHGRVNAHRALLPLMAPANFQLSTPPGAYVTLTWSATNNPLLQHYEVERKLNSGSWTVITTTTNTSFTDGAFRIQGSNYTAQYRARQKSTNGIYGIYTNALSAVGNYIPIEGEEVAIVQSPTEFSLRQNSPNPFNPSTIIRYEIPEEGYVTLTVFDQLGREIKELYSGYRVPGAYEATFNAGDLSSGLYYYKLQSGSFVAVKKMLLMK